MKTLFLIRGLPGSGKSTFASTLLCSNYEADMYFDLFNGGKFDAKLLGKAHEWCRQEVNRSMDAGVQRIAVSNTFTQAWEIQPYHNLAEKYGYTVFQMIVENHHNSDSVHGVPEGTILKMRKRFDLML